MMSISTDKKLELLRGIRLENQRNHQLCRNDSTFWKLLLSGRLQWETWIVEKVLLRDGEACGSGFLFPFCCWVDLLLPTRWNGTIAALIAICSCNR